MGNSQENRNHTAESAMERNGWIPRSSLMSKIAQIGVLLFCTVNPDNAFASLSPRTVDMSYGQKNDKNEPMIYADIEEKCVISSAQILKIGSEAYALVGITNSLDDINKMAIAGPDFIRLAEKYGADTGLIKSILSKKNISKDDKKILIGQAKLITQSWIEIAKQHYKNLTALYSTSKDEATKTNIQAKMEETMGMYGSLTSHAEFLDGLMNQ